MSAAMTPWILAIVAVDVVVGLVIIRRVLERSRAGRNGPVIAGLDLKALREFADTVHPRVGEYVRANWSGVPSDLPGVLGHLLDDLERDAKDRGLPLGRPILKQLIERSLHSLDIGRSEVREALKQIA
jgi:hypothetical protein